MAILYSFLDIKKLLQLKQECDINYMYVDIKINNSF